MPSLDIFLSANNYSPFSFSCRSDPTENDSVEGLRPNARGPGLVTFGVSDLYLAWIISPIPIQLFEFFLSLTA